MSDEALEPVDQPEGAGDDAPSADSTGDSPAEGHSGPVLEGISGWVSGERFLLADGEVVIGRSRSCDISMRRVEGYLSQPADERDKDHDFNTISRRHVDITVNGSVVRLRDSSTNGTFINDKPLEEPSEYDLAEQGLELRLGTRETFRLAMAGSAGGAPSVSAGDDNGAALATDATDPSQRLDIEVEDHGDDLGTETEDVASNAPSEEISTEEMDEPPTESPIDVVDSDATEMTEPDEDEAKSTNGDGLG
jgi:pSer/pThr/pTyr-binding forkhead associated (FHA) protein